MPNQDPVAHFYYRVTLTSSSPFLRLITVDTLTPSTANRSLYLASSVVAGL